MIRFSLLFLLAMGLVSCSYISKSSFSQNKDRNYLAAQSLPPLKIPPGIATSSFQAAYPIPAGNYSVSAENVDVTPPGLYQG